jgi:hypothetical protein
LNQSSLAARLGTTSQVVNKWINHGVLPEGRFLVQLPELLHVSGHWLLTGDGEMRPPPSDIETAAYRRIAEIVKAAEAATAALETADRARQASDRVLAKRAGNAR